MDKRVCEQRTLEVAGFTREGVVRSTGWEDGAWRDGMTYSLLRTDPRVWPSSSLGPGRRLGSRCGLVYGARHRRSLV